MALAATATTTTQATTAQREAKQAEWNARAIALAEKAHATGTAHHIGENSSGAQLYRVPSWSHDGAIYLVSVWRCGDVLCCCTAGNYSRPCKHAGAALHAERQRKEALRSTTDEGLRTWAHGGAW